MSQTNLSMNDVVDFAQYLHNPWGYLSKKQDAAIVCSKRKEKFVQNYSVNQHLTDLLETYFSDLKLLHKFGLNKFYNLLKVQVVEQNLIGIILCGATMDDNDNKIISIYTTQENKEITLDCRSICRFLIKDHIKMKNVDALCEKIPNFNIYYNK